MEVGIVSMALSCRGDMDVRDKSDMRDLSRPSASLHTIRAARDPDLAESSGPDRPEPGGPNTLLPEAVRVMPPFSGDRERALPGPCSMLRN